VISIKEAKAKAVYCPPGCFQMGASSSDVEAYHYEKPQHEVRLTRGFWMWQTPVTQGQFSSLMGYNPSSFPGHDHRPVEQLSWFEAAAFCNALSRLQGLDEVYLLHGNGREVTAEVHPSYAGSAYYEAKGWRLPTEAEWEYACRSHATTPRYGASEMIAWYWENSEKQTQPVAQKQANAWGLHDMLGNVYEWCYDWWSDYSLRSQSDPVTSQGGSQRVQRGGCWYYRAEYCRASYRYCYAPNTCYNNLGFRVVKTQTS
jgi:formylglycine-generating enzyme required for sulfatase activity